MKKLKSLLLILLVAVTMLPFSVKAENKKPETNKEPVNVYLFRSNTCGYCEAALEWFNSIEKEYGAYFNLVDYEVSSEENYNLWSETAEFMGDAVGGVPYIVVGKYTYPNGFGADSLVSSTSKQTMGDQMIERILEIYESDNRYDVMKEINNKPNYNNIVGISALVIIAGLVVVTIITRRQSR